MLIGHVDSVNHLSGASIRHVLSTHLHYYTPHVTQTANTTHKSHLLSLTPALNNPPH